MSVWDGIYVMCWGILKGKGNKSGATIGLEMVGLCDSRVHHPPLPINFSTSFWAWALL